MRPSEATATSRLIRRVIKGCPIYNDKARKSEIAKYVPTELADRVAKDPDGVFVAVAGRKIVGFCVNGRDDGLLLLEWYGVHPEWRQHGIGRLMLDRLVGSARRRGCHKVWCDTHIANTASAKVLCSLGFQPLCTLHNHWYGQDFTLWEKMVPRLAVVREDGEVEEVVPRRVLQRTA
jgi:ribosomal protein S18 acetylase RimI-like enzyme